MQLRLAFAGLLGALILCAQDLEVSRAQARLDRLRELAAVGAAPRVEVEKAEAAVADAKDNALLRGSFLAKDLTPEQADEIVAAASRRLDRRQRLLGERQRWLEAGLIAKSELDGLAQDVSMARRDLELATSRARVVRELEEMAEAEARAEALARNYAPEQHGVSERYDGNGVFTDRDLRGVETAFARHFDKALPVSAAGETAVHRALGFDHRGRVDVAINPDQPEGIWLRHYLESRHIPYFAFRMAVPGKATGAHIHLGPLSIRLQRA